jgi:hypothetical protein
MRHIQSAALFGLMGGSLLMFVGMTGGTMTLTFVGMALGMLLGVPAAYLNFMMQGYMLDMSRFRLVKPGQPGTTIEHRPRTLPPARRPQLDAPRPPAQQSVDTGEVVEIPVRQVEPTPPPAPSEPVKIPVQVSPADDTPPPAPPPPTEPPAAPEPPPVPALSNAERQAIIDAVSAEQDAVAVLPYADHTDTLVRLYAVQRLGTLADDVARSRLEAALDDPEAIVQRAARLALNQLPQE